MSKKSALTLAKEERALAENRLATIEAAVQAKALERTRAFIEAQQPVVVPWQQYPQFDNWGMPSSPMQPYLWAQSDDRSEGNYLPVYANAFDVRRLRAQSRSLFELFPVARGALKKLSDYVMGTGFNFLVQPVNVCKHEPLAIELATIVQTKVDRLLEYNNFTGSLDREIHETSRVDGDAFPTLYPEDDNVRIELTDPACIVEPQNADGLNKWLKQSHKLNYWWHGVHTQFSHAMKRDDVARPFGYHAVFDRQGEQWDYLPSRRVEHVKRNVGRSGRVGINDFVSIQSDLENEGKIRRNTAVGAAILAAITLIRQHAEGASKSTVERMVAASATASYDKSLADGSSRLTYGEQLQPGTTKDCPAGMTMTVGPLGVLRSPVYIEVAAYLLRIIGSPWSMPEYLISGDASNANYASTLVSESPFIKYCEHEQAWYANHFERLIWKAVRMLHDMGQFPHTSWKAICCCLDIKADYSSPASRDAATQTQVNEKLHEKGIMSKRTWAADHGLDYDEEQTRIAAEPKPPIPIVQPMPVANQPYSESRIQELANHALEMARVIVPNINVSVPPAEVSVNVPEQPTPSVTVNIPEQPTPTVTVNVPEQPAPNVTVAAPNVTIEPASVHVTVPEMPATVVPAPIVNVNVPDPPDMDVELERDAAGMVKKMRRTKRKGK